MLFNSYNFLFLFLPATLLGLLLVRRFAPLRAAIWWLGLASLVFYGTDHPEFLSVILGSIFGNYLLGSRFPACATDGARRFWLTLGIAGNLVLLGYFKYTHFLAEIINSALHAGLPEPHIILPIGISFYTFTQIAYLVDQYRNPHRYRFSDYLLFVSFFPHLVAGPILIHKYIIPQFESSRMGRPSARTLVTAVVFFCVGMAKKVLIADNLSPFVASLYSASGNLGAIEAWGAALLYTLQLYFDFSGYSEMAFGLGLMLNVRIPLNFNAPYRSVSMIDFWRRWHMSLSRFLRDYLYIPLGGNRKGEARRYFNIFFTMLLGGIWHGAGWNFVAWGAIHATGITLNHAWHKTKIRIHPLLGWLITLFIVVHAWVFFRAANVGDAKRIIGSMYGAQGWHARGPMTVPDDAHAAAAWLAAGWLLVLLAPTTRRLALTQGHQWWMAVFCALLLVASILNFAKVSEFLYFQF